MSFSHKKRVLITGASGLIGKELEIPLLEAGFDIYALTRNVPSSTNQVKWVKGDLFNPESLHTIMREIAPEYLLNLAWETTGDYLSSETNYKFLNAGVILLQEFARNGGKRAIYVGTCFEYKFKDTHLSENDELDEKKNTYSFCKNALNQLASYYCQTHNISYGYGRIFYVYGRNEDKSRLTGMLVDKLSKNQRVIIKSGSLYKDYMYTKDIARALVKFLDGKVTGNVNICSGNAISIKELSMKIASLMNKEQLLDFEDECSSQPPIIVGDNTRMINEVGYTPRYSLSEALCYILTSPLTV